MFFSPDDDDDFNPSFGGSKSNLSSLFGADQAAFGSSKRSNESLTYTAPKQPKKQAAPSGQDAPPAVIHAVATSVFKFVNGQYASQGKLGVAILGNHVKKEYRLLVYASKQQQVTSAKITNSFSFVVQENNYSSFYDDARQSWSLRFDTLQIMNDFAKQIGLARYNSAPGSLTKQDLQPGDGQQAVESGDAIEVKYTGSLWTNNSFGKVFDSNAAADKLFKFRPGKGKVIKGWEDGVLGMKKGGKRLLAIPPELAYGDKGVPSRVPPKSTLLFEVEISRVKFSKEKSENVSSETSTPPPAHEQSQKDDVTSTSSAHSRREDEHLRDRTVSLNKELSASPEKGSEKAKLLARMSKMGKNVLKIPGAVAADPDENEHEPAEEAHSTPSTPAEPEPERPRIQSREYHDPGGNPHPHSPTKPRIPPRSAHVNRAAHVGHSPGHMTQPHATQQYQTEFQNPPPTHSQIPSQPQTLALYQAPLQQQPPPVYQHSAQYAFPQPQPPFQPVFQQPAQPVFQPPPAPSPQPATNTGTSDVMMPVLMSESRQHQTELRQAITKVSEKIDGLEHKIELLKQSNDGNSGAIKPAGAALSDENIMEASVLMNSIVKLVQENEKVKRENVEKTAKIEGLNEKISDLLHRSQKYVEQSNIFLEQRNESLQQSSSYSQSKLVQLEREKATMSTELGTYKQNFATMETELEILRKQDAENRELLKKTSSQLQKNKAELETTKENLTEREEEVEKLSSSVKNLKQERKKLEGSFSSLEDAVSDLKQEKESLQKNLSERKKKHAEVKKRMDEEMEELKSGHEEELNSVKERHRRELTSSNSSVSQQISQLESEMEAKWQGKSKQMVEHCEKKWQRKYDDITEECDTLKKNMAESEEKYLTIKTSHAQSLQEIENLQERLKDMEDMKNKYKSIQNLQNRQQKESEELREKLKDMENTQRKYQDLRNRSIEMKGKYEQRIQELEAAVEEARKKSSEAKQEASIQQQAPEPSRDKIVNEVKQIMNKVFFKIREEFVAGDSYQGSTVIAVVLNVIKSMTLKLTSGAGKDEESEEESGEEESDEEQEDGEISEDEYNESEQEGESEEEEGKENESEKVEEVENAKVEEVQSEKQEHERNKENAGGKVEDEGNGEEVHGSEKEGSVGKVEDKESGEEEEGMGKEIQGEVQKDAKDSQEETKKNDDEQNENKQAGRNEEKIANEDKQEASEGTLADHGDKDIPEDIARISEVIVESPLHTKYSDSEGDEENKGIEVPPLGIPGDGVEHLGRDAFEPAGQLGVSGGSGSSEDDLENVSNKPVHGSEQDASISSEEEQDTLVDMNKQGPLGSVLPGIDELSGTDKDTEAGEDEGLSKTFESKNDEEEIGSEKTTNSEAEAAVEEKAKEEKKAQSLADFLSDDEDDVEGLFDAPPLKTTPVKPKDEGPSLKAIPPPLFDDDDEDDLDWFS